MDYVLGKFREPEKDKTQEWAKYTKGEVRAQRMLIETIKGHLFPFITDLGTSKAIYDKLVKIYFVRTTSQKISLRNKLYKVKLSKDEDLKDQLKCLEKWFPILN